MQKQTGSLHSWLWHRISAVFLVFGLFIHFVYVHVAIIPPLTYQKVAQRMAENMYFWVVFDIMLLLATIYHGLLGVYNIFCDYSFSKQLKETVKYALIAIGFLMFIIGIWILIPFTS
ncbi:MAG: succinate dehydrogenase, hydrophobic membrane anchor protein [Pseudomonadota bacterium]